MRTHENKSENFRFEEFSDIYEFGDTIKVRPINERMRRLYGSIEKCVSHWSPDVDWYGTETFDEAQRLLEEGYEEGVRMIEAKSKPLQGRTYRYETAVVGFAPAIPNAIMGLPNSMITTRERAIKQREITLWYSIMVGFNVSASKMADVSRHLLDAVNYLEGQGTHVRIVVTCIVRIDNDYNEYNEYLGCSFVLKEANQPLNLKKVSYPLVHPSFFRRHMFNWLETTPIISRESCNVSEDTCRNHHGLVPSAQKQAELLRSVGLLKKCDVFLCTTELLRINSAAELLTLIQEQNNKH